jgi:hypothetical protein
MFELLRWMKNLHQSMRNHEMLYRYAARSSEGEELKDEKHLIRQFLWEGTSVEDG